MTSKDERLTPEAAYDLGRQYAQQENGALAGMAEAPVEPELDSRMRRHFELGYVGWWSEQDADEARAGVCIAQAEEAQS